MSRNQGRRDTEVAPPHTYVNRTHSTSYVRVCKGPQRDEYVHVLIAQAMLGRKLLPTETVDHKDGNTLNNEWTNLEVVTRKENTLRMMERNGACPPRDQ